LFTTYRTYLLAVVLLSAVLAPAQDTRTVKEPAIPPVCRSLDAKLSAGGEGIPEGAEVRLDTVRIQQAIDQCQAGTAVELRANGAKNGFLSGPLELRQGITLLVSRGATLFASRNPRDYDLTPGVCGTVDNSGIGCRPLISVRVHNAAVMGEGVIDGRGGAKLIGQNVSWWDLAEQAKTNRVKVETPGHNAPHILVGDKADGLVLYRITVRNSPHFNVIVYRTDGFTVWGVKIHNPETARNTDGIDPSSSRNVSILHSYIHTGDDHIAIKASAGGPSTHMTIAHNHFYAGDGVSIGSGTQGGVSDIEVLDLTIQGARHGIHIKSSPNRGGLVHRVSYQDVCLQDVQRPILFETTYKRVTVGTLIPQYEDILLRDVRISGGGTISLGGFDGAHLLRLAFDGVTAADAPAVQVRGAHARIATGPGEVNFVPAGEDVLVTKVSGSRKVPPCKARFVPFPSEPTR
jgi:polygalacturonase